MIKTKKSEIIIGLVGALYILSTIPFLLNGAGLPTITRISLVVLSALGVAGLFLFSTSRRPKLNSAEANSGEVLLYDLEQHQTREMSLLSGATGGFMSYMDTDWNNISSSRASFEFAIWYIIFYRWNRHRI